MQHVAATLLRLLKRLISTQPLAMIFIVTTFEKIKTFVPKISNGTPSRSVFWNDGRFAILPFLGMAFTKNT